MTRALLDIDNELWKAGRKYALDNDLTVNELVTVALKALLGKPTTKAAGPLDLPPPRGGPKIAGVGVVPPEVDQMPGLMPGSLATETEQPIVTSGSITAQATIEKPFREFRPVPKPGGKKKA